MKTADLNKLLRGRFCAPEWAIFFEVGDSTGFSTRRHADAVAMNLWPSRGCAIHGFEVKVSRSDWQRELRQPAKSEPIQRFCDHWWIVAPKGIVLDGELPSTWGLYEADGRGLRCKVQAPKLDAAPLTREFFAAMARGASAVGAIERKQIVDDALQDERAAIQRRIDDAVKWSTRSHKELQASVDAFEAASGMQIAGWKGGADLGQAAKLVQDLGLTSTYGGIKRLAEDARRFADRVDEVLPSLRVADADAAERSAAA